MKIFVASHPEAGNVCAGRSVEKISARLIEIFEYESAKPQEHSDYLEFNDCFGNTVTYIIDQFEV